MAEHKATGLAAGVSAAGAGGGTLLVLYATSLPDTNQWKQLLLLASPSLSVFVGVAWLWIRVQIANYVQWKTMQSLAKGAKATLLEAIANPNTSDEHKKKLRARLEEVELILSDHQLKRIRDFTVVTAQDVRDTERTFKDSLSTSTPEK
jgi:hypothetical protein